MCLYFVKYILLKYLRAPFCILHRPQIPKNGPAKRDPYNLFTKNLLAYNISLHPDILCASIQRIISDLANDMLLYKRKCIHLYKKKTYVFYIYYGT